jgi:hypothetical protein
MLSEQLDLRLCSAWTEGNEVIAMESSFLNGAHVPKILVLVDLCLRACALCVWNIDEYFFFFSTFRTRSDPARNQFRSDGILWLWNVLSILVINYCGLDICIEYTEHRNHHQLEELSPLSPLTFRLLNRSFCRCSIMFLSRLISSISINDHSK